MSNQPRLLRVPNLPGPNMGRIVVRSHPWALALCLLCSSPLHAAPPSKEEFIQRLSTPPQTDDPAAAFPVESLPSKAFRKTKAPDANGACQSPASATAGSTHRNLVVVTIPAQPGNAPNTNLELQFGHDSDYIDELGQRELNNLAAALNSAELADRRFLIIGHTNSLGQAKHNLELSCARSLAVMRHLAKRNVAPHRLAPYGFGSMRPHNANTAEAPENRRVEVRRLEK